MKLERSLSTNKSGLYPLANGEPLECFMWTLDQITLLKDHLSNVEDELYETSLEIRQVRK